MGQAGKASPLSAHPRQMSSVELLSLGNLVAFSMVHLAGAERTLETPPLPVHQLVCSATDLQALGQFPLAYPLGLFHPDVLPLRRSQAGPAVWETALSPRVRVACD